MKPLGLHRDRHMYNTAKCTRTRDRRDAQRVEREGVDLDGEPPFCEACGGPCTGLGSFVTEKRSDGVR